MPQYVGHYRTIWARFVNLQSVINERQRAQGLGKLEQNYWLVNVWVNSFKGLFYEALHVLIFYHIWQN